MVHARLMQPETRLIDLGIVCRVSSAPFEDGSSIIRTEQMIAGLQHARYAEFAIYCMNLRTGPARVCT